MLGNMETNPIRFLIFHSVVPQWSCQSARIQKEMSSRPNPTRPSGVSTSLGPHLASAHTDPSAIREGSGLGD